MKHITRNILLGLLVLGCWLIVPRSAAAHGDPYFEFSPDEAASLRIGDYASAAQVFLPQNEFLGGFDFWVDNPGPGGVVTFRLRDANNNTIASKNAIVPHSDAVPGGTRIHVDLINQVPVFGSQKYRFEIITSLADLNFYYAPRILFLEHNAPPTSEYVNGAARINGEEKEFSFKFALYENTETALPIISNASTTVVSSSQVRVNFNANEPVDYKISYGIAGGALNQQTGYRGVYEFCGVGVGTCGLTVSTIPNQSYNFTLFARDSWGNETSYNGSFLSYSEPVIEQAPEVLPSDTAPPVISNFRVINITSNSADVVWSTNEAANSSLLVSFTDISITIAAANDTTFELEHLLNTGNNLTQDTAYFVTARSRDIYDNEARATTTFTTLAAQAIPASPPPSLPPPTLPLPPPSPPPPPPPLSSPSTQTSGSVSVEIQNSGNAGSYNAVVNWQISSASEPTEGYRVDLFDENKKLIGSALVKAGARSADFKNIKEGEYSAIVYANEEGAFKKIDKPKEFEARKISFWEAITLRLPYITGGLALFVVILIVIFKFAKKRSIIPKTGS